jgi:hypothetical protein
MPESFDSGIPGVAVGPGDHICAFYFAVADRDRVLIPYLEAGLRGGDKCICIVDATDPAQGRFSPTDMLGYWTASVTARS